MDLFTLAIVALIVLSLGGVGYGYYGAPAGAPAAWVNPLGGVVALLVLILIVMLATGWRFGFEALPPG